MIEFQNISKAFKYNFWDKKINALTEVSFTIRKGELVGFLGANGAGKTTLIKILMDFSRQDSGEVIFSSEMGTTQNEIKASMGFLPEKAYLYQHLTGKEFLNYICRIYNLGDENAKNLISEWSEKMGLTYALDRQIRGYSKGMQQRLGFISAVIHEPKFLVLDEPLSGLDPIGRRDFKKILHDLNKKGITIFFSSHIVSDVEEICNKVIFLEKGKLIYEGSVDELILKNTKDSFKVKYIENERLESVYIDNSQKNSFLKELVSKNLEIIEVEKRKPSLEEIIYKIKR